MATRPEITVRNRRGCPPDVVRAIREAARLAPTITEIRHWLRVEVYPTVTVTTGEGYCGFGTPGNHGRLPDAKKVSTKDPTRSWDYLIYEVAKIALRDCPNVTVETPPAWAVMYDIEGKLFYQGHGHFVKSWNSIPFYGINRMTSRLGAVLAKHYRPVDYWLFGHFHVHGSIENAGGEYLINPPLIGPQEFGVHTFGEAVPPGQTLFGVHPEHGITHRWRLHAEPKWPPVDRAFDVTKVRR